ncbi:MAG: MATE family efflux transporter [Clostridiales bacterium]|nr:MATE family efflux transporter [Clostridiales bacterium]
MKRARKSLYYAISTSLIFGIAMFLLAFFHGNILAGIFSTDYDVIIAAGQYMKAYAIDCILVLLNIFCYLYEKTKYVCAIIYIKRSMAYKAMLQNFYQILYLILYCFLVNKYN